MGRERPWGLIAVVALVAAALGVFAFVLVLDLRSGGGGAPGGRVDLNTATLEQLDQLPGVGPVTAQRILEWRTRNGRFATVDQLREVEGIGERRFGQLRALVRV